MAESKTPNHARASVAQPVRYLAGESESTQQGTRKGAYWGIRTDIADYELPDALGCPHPRTLVLAATPTRLKRLPDQLQEQLINWGYAVCDAALRKHVAPTLTRPADFPYPAAGV